MKSYLKSYEMAKLTAAMRFVLIAICLLATNTMIAQELTSYIPADVKVVGTLNIGNYSKKVDLNEFKELPMYQSGMESMKKMGGPMGQTLQEVIENPEDYGMDLLSPAYFYMQQEEAVDYTSLLFRLSSAAKFQQLLESLTGGFLPVEDKGGFKMMAMGSDNALAWNEQMATVIMGKRDTSSISEFPAPLNIPDRLTKLMNKEMGKSIKTNTFFQRSQAEPADLMVWIDRSLMKEWQMSKTEGTGMGTDWVDELFEGAYDTDVRMALHFNKGEVRMDADYLGEVEKIKNLKKFYREDQWNEDFVKYMPGKDLLGHFAMNLNPKQMISMYQSFMKGMMSTMPDSTKSDGFTEFMQSGKIEDFVDMFAGDMIVAVTGMHEFENVVTQLEYDDNFEEVEVEKTVKERFPKMLGLFTCSNVPKAQSFLDEQWNNGMLKKRGEVYEIGDESDPNHLHFHLMLHDGILFFSNDAATLNNGQPKKYSKKERMTNDQYKMLKERVMLMHADVASIMTIMENDQAANNSGKDNVNKGKQSVESFIMEVGKEPDPNKMRMSMLVNFAAKEKNSLIEMMGLAESFLPLLMGMRM